MFTKGHIAVNRTIKDRGFYHNPEACTLWFHLFVDANFKDGEWDNIIIKRGELVTSIPELSQDTGLSIQQVRTALKRLGGAGEVQTRSVGKRTIITLCKYDYYQGEQHDDNGLLTDYQHDSNKEATDCQHPIIEQGNNATRKEEKKKVNNTKKSKYSPEVEELYKMYPTKCPVRNTETGRRPFCKAILERMLEERSFDDIKRNMEIYLRENYGKHYLQNFETFLHRFPDYSEDSGGLLFQEKKWKVKGERYNNEEVKSLVRDQNEFQSIPPVIRMALHDGKEIIWDGEKFVIADTEERK